MKILIVLGGTDPLKLAPRIAIELSQARPSTEISIVASSLSADQKLALQLANSRLTVLPFVEDLPQLASLQDAVISASGTSIWDFMCIGVPIGALCVVDNQVPGYRRIVDNNLVIGLGEPQYTDLSSRIQEFTDFLNRPRDIELLARRGQILIDGRGAQRIVKVWEQLI